MKRLPLLLLGSIVLASCQSTEKKEVPEEPVDIYANPNQLGEDVPNLQLGQNAPAYKIERWMHGQPMPTLEKGKVYVVEFWASWCQPCRKSIPHLSRLQRELGSEGLQVLAIAASETDGVTGLERLLEKQKDQIGYTIGYTSDQSGFKNWMWSARNSGLPWAFIVDRTGKVVWWGQPFFSRFESVLRAVVNGTYDWRKESPAWSADHEKRKPLWDVQSKFWEAYGAEKWEECLAEGKHLIASGDEAFYYEAATAFEVLYQKLNQDTAFQMGQSLAGGTLAGIPEGLAVLARTILDAPQSKAHLEWAWEIANRILALTENKNPEALALAASIAAKLQKPESQTLLQEALDLADDDELKAKIQAIK